MRVQAVVTGEYRDVRVSWPLNMPVPREGDSVWGLLDSSGKGIPPQYVRSVSWYPHGDSEDKAFQPFVHVVLGPRRPD